MFSFEFLKVRDSFENMKIPSQFLDDKGNNYPIVALRKACLGFAGDHLFDYACFSLPHISDCLADKINDINRKR